jgi:hypothetical protein
MPPTRRESESEPLTDRRRALPTLRIKISAAERAARREWRDALAALGAITWMHTVMMPPAHVRSLNGT